MVTLRTATGLGLVLALLPSLCGCSSFWDRSPVVAGARAPVVREGPSGMAQRGARVPSEPYVAQVQPTPDRTPRPNPAPTPRSYAPRATTPTVQPTTEDMNVLAQVNAIRAQRGLRALRFNARLWQAAHDHSEEQLRHGYMGHGSPDPRRNQLLQRIQIAGYDGRAFGEVVAYGYRDVRRVVEGWMNSREHRAILVEPDYSEAGFSRIGDYWTGNFGAPSVRAVRQPSFGSAPRRAPQPRPVQRRPVQPKAPPPAKPLFQGG